MQNVPYWRLSGFYFFYFATVGVIFPFWSPYLHYLEFSPAAIGFLAAIPTATKIIAPNFWGWLIDRSGKLTRYIQIGSFLAALTFIAVFF